MSKPLIYNALLALHGMRANNLIKSCRCMCIYSNSYNNNI